MYNPRHHIFCVFTEQIHQLMAFLIYRTVYMYMYMYMSCILFNV